MREIHAATAVASQVVAIPHTVPMIDACKHLRTLPGRRETPVGILLPGSLRHVVGVILSITTWSLTCCWYDTQYQDMVLGLSTSHTGS